MLSLKYIEKVSLILSLIFISGGLFIFTIPDGVSNSEMTEKAEEGNIVSQVIYFIIYLMSFSLAYNKKKKILELIKSQKTLLLLLALCLLSSIWSTNTGVSLRRVFALLGPTALGFYLAVRFPLYDAIKIFNTTFLIMALLSLLTVILLPSYGLMDEQLNGVFYVGAWKGIFPHKNVLGRNMAILMILGFILFNTTKQKRYLIEFALGIILIIQSQSMTSLITALVSIAFILFLNIIKQYKKYFIISLLLLISCIGTVIYSINNTNAFLTLLGRDSTFTGRAIIWDKSYNAILEHPLLGYGYGAFWIKSNVSASTIWHSLSWSAPNAHNGFIDIALQVGLVGLILFLLFFIPNYILYVKKTIFYKTNLFNWGISIFSISFIYNFFETNILMHNDIYWLLITFTISSYYIINKYKGLDSINSK